MSEAQRIFRSLGLGTRMKKPDFLKNAKQVASPAALPAAQLDFFGKTQNKETKKRKAVEKKPKKTEVKEEPKDSEEDEPAKRVKVEKGEEDAEEDDEQSEEEVEADEPPKDVYEFRAENNIQVQGEDPPEPIRSFSELEKFGVKNTLITSIGKCGYTQPTPIQMQATTAMLTDREVIAIAPTGSGKTMAFAVSLLSNLKEHKKRRLQGCDRESHERAGFPDTQRDKQTGTKHEPKKLEGVSVGQICGF